MNIKNMLISGGVLRDAHLLISSNSMDLHQPLLIQYPSSSTLDICLDAISKPDRRLPT